ncbi:hypothetical protein KL86DPRO_50079 [uncultured delta proteobacterium]|uniref:Uncharacterized protein n=1 Tax=uncultured delta proteobacterium TaxID=34034 RepID=A0A212KBP6_9DELT|nr:hypothetical protein KL86DPRO_50079 [uncultured delta proteobacterium]
MASAGPLSGMHPEQILYIQVLSTPKMYFSL